MLLSGQDTVGWEDLTNWCILNCASSDYFIQIFRASTEEKAKTVAKFWIWIFITEERQMVKETWNLVGMCHLTWSTCLPNKKQIEFKEHHVTYSYNNETQKPTKGYETGPTYHNAPKIVLGAQGPDVIFNIFLLN